jgi:hypothetical protein
VLLASSRTRRVRYRPRRLTGIDWMVIAVLLAAPGALALLTIAGDDSLTWSASPLRWPTFQLLPALAIGLLLAPLAHRPVPVRASRPLRRIPERVEAPA